MNKIASLKTALREIASIHNEEFDEYTFDKELDNLFESNGFFTDEQVPDWLGKIFRAVLSREVIPKTPYQHNSKVHGDVSNLLAELEELIQINWIDEGERVEFSSNKLNMFGNISIEDETYQVGMVSNIK
jgi:hypothetical protein